jgi:hypothetical protein
VKHLLRKNKEQVTRDTYRGKKLSCAKRKRSGIKKN